MHKSKVTSRVATDLLHDMQALLDRLDASEYSLAAARLSSAMDALSDAMVNVRTNPAIDSIRSTH